MRKETVYINIGSNIGDRRDNLSRAVAAVSERLGLELKVSDVVESAPWGYDSPNSFLNVGAVFETDLEPESLLAVLQDVERSISPASHRDSNGAYVDRIIDIDLIAVGSMVVGSPRLTLPHPAMAQRPFVLMPLSQLLPQWRHPLTGLTADEMMALL